MRMKKCVLIIVLCSCINMLYAQRDNQKWYLNGIGLRLEAVSTPALEGVDYEHFFNPRFAVNAMFLTEFHTVYEGGLLFKYVAPYPNITSRLRWYAGGGFTGGTEIGNKELQETEDNVYLGPAACLGTGYSFEKIPLNICVEWKPVWNVYDKLYDKTKPNQDRLDVKTVAITLRFITRDKYKR